MNSVVCAGLARFLEKRIPGRAALEWSAMSCTTKPRDRSRSRACRGVSATMLPAMSSAVGEVALYVKTAMGYVGLRRCLLQGCGHLSRHLLDLRIERDPLHFLNGG